MDKAKPCVTPVSTSQPLIKSDGIPFHDPHFKYMQNLMEPHWAAVKRILRYLKNTISHLQTFSDADWAFDCDERSIEAEYKALANAAAEIQWIKSLLTNLRVPIIHSPILWCNNIGATYLTNNPLFHARTKHIEIDFHYVHDQVLRGQLHVKFVSTKDQYADALTKSLPSSIFLRLHDNLKVNETNSSIEDSSISGVQSISTNSTCLRV
ncbi:hypothetical protein AAG906_038445 [Vitis piasezkii]